MILTASPLLYRLTQGTILSLKVIEWYAVLILSSLTLKEIFPETVSTITVIKVPLGKSYSFL